MTQETDSRPPGEYLTDEEALAYLGVKSSDFERLLKEYGIGRYRTYTPGRPVVFAKRDLEKLKSAVPPPAPPRAEAPARPAAVRPAAAADKPAEPATKAEDAASSAAPAAAGEEEPSE